MKHLVEFKIWANSESLNEQNDPDYVWGFKASDSYESGWGVGFPSLKGFYNYKRDGYPLADGLTKEMNLLDWMKTDGFLRCEEKVIKIIADEPSKQVVQKFKEKFPEKYAMMIAWATHDPLPRDYSEVERKSPLQLGKNVKLFAADFYSNYIEPGVAAEPKSGEPVVVPPITYPAIKIEIPQDIDTSGFFEFNSWSLSDVFKKWVAENVINPAKETLGKLNPPEGKPKAFLSYIKVITSCSTVPNGTSPEDKKKHTFAELSNLRAESALKYLKDELKKIGVLVDEDTKTEKDTKGTNAGKKSTKAYASQPIGTDLTGTSGEEWDGSDDNRTELKKYQKVQIDATLIFNNTKPAEEIKGTETKPETTKTDPKKPVEVKEKAFFVTITANEKWKPKWKWPSFNIDLSSIFKFENKGNYGSTKCPKF